MTQPIINLSIISARALFLNAGGMQVFVGIKVFFMLICHTSYKTTSGRESLRKYWDIFSLEIITKIPKEIITKITLKKSINHSLEII